MNIGKLQALLEWMKKEVTSKPRYVILMACCGVPLAPYFSQILFETSLSALGVSRWLPRAPNDRTHYPYYERDRITEPPVLTQDEQDEQIRQGNTQRTYYFSMKKLEEEQRMMTTHAGRELIKLREVDRRKRREARLEQLGAEDVVDEIMANEDRLIEAERRDVQNALNRRHDKWRHAENVLFNKN